MNARNLLALQSVLLVLLIVVVGVGIMLPYVAPPRGATPTPSGPTSQWEYLTVNYTQSTNYAENPNNDRYELVTADQEPYASQFITILYEGCDGIAGDFSAEMNCVSGNFKGREYFLNLLGQDGWELVQVDNQSSQYTYQVELLLKRPVR